MLRNCGRIEGFSQLSSQQPKSAEDERVGSLWIARAVSGSTLINISCSKLTNSVSKALFQLIDRIGHGTKSTLNHVRYSAVEGVAGRQSGIA